MKKLILLFFILTISVGIFAATKTWSGGTGTGKNWTTGSNWGGTAPASGDDIVFNTAGTITFSTMPSSVSYNSLAISQGNITLAHTSSTTLTLGGNAGTDFTIASGASLTLGTNVNITMANSATGSIEGSLIVNSSRTFDTDNTSVLTTVTGIIKNAGTVSGTTARLVFTSGGKYQHNWTSSSGNVPTATWSDGSTVEVIGYSNSSTLSQAPGNLDAQSFYNFVWNCPSQAGIVSMSSALETVRGDLTITNTGNNLVFLRQSQSDAPYVTTVIGNVIINGGSLGLTTNIGGSTLTVGGNFTMSSGTLNMCSGTGNSTLNIAGNFTQTSGTITESSTGIGTIVFNGSGTQTFSLGGTKSNNINLTVNKGSGSLVLNSNLPMNGTDTLRMAQGNINLNGNTLTLGTATNSKGTLIWTNGFMVGAGTFTRWFDNSTAITIGTNAGLFPMGSGSSNRSVWFAGTPSTGGTLSVQHSDQTGITVVPVFDDGGVSVNRRHNMNWTLSTANSFNDANAQLRIQGTGIAGITVVADLRMIRASDAVGTSSNGTNTVSNPQVNRTGLSGAELNNTFYFGGNSTINPLSELLVDAMVFLEGPYNSSDMNTTLNSYLPTTQPYGVSPWNYTGSESVASGFFATHTDIVDWVLVELRNESLVTVGTRAALLKNDGNIIGLDGASPVDFSGNSAGDYYIVIHHRNHLSIMSDDVVPLSGSSSLYDFTIGNGNQFYPGDGSGAKELELGIWGMIAGDTDGSGVVDLTDRSNTWNNRNITGYNGSDTNLSSTVELQDRLNTWNNRNKTTMVP